MWRDHLICNIGLLSKGLLGISITSGIMKVLLTLEQFTLYLVNWNVWFYLEAWTSPGATKSVNFTKYAARGAFYANLINHP